MTSKPGDLLYVLSPADVAAQVGAHPKTVNAWADAGLIPCFRTPGGHRKFRQSDVDAFVAERTGPVERAS